MPVNPHITVLGMGALGQLYAGSLAKLGAQVTGLSRAGTVESVNFMTPQGLQKVALSTELPELYDILLVTTKAYQAVDAVQSHARAIGPNTTILLLHNGMGTLAPLKKRFPDCTIWLGTSSHGALLEHGILKHTGAGETWLGFGYGDRNSEQESAFAELLNQALTPCQFSDNINHKLWLKLAINSVINPLTALHQCRNGDLNSQRFAPQIQALCEEFSLLSLAEGLDLSPEFIQQTVYQVIDKTAANYSSMNRDISARRPTENNQISGYVVSRAAHFGIAVPTHSKLFETLCRLERRQNSTSLL
ncbi:ketopantoate reductase family protein [Corallincola spongiicola]|uniref:2-dehydropantoate 2-reductase n=1 Tax=Corallincola spongiicola TaxID=2520508 RepID=A0ABY1WSE6_9GAMM|nr:2-dehydropantoate 2-reductase [Corallincola spongiicola]TAA47540.1 2-dehydropantoate 2-reductase [Corallincola spongiicola]